MPENTNPGTVDGFSDTTDGSVGIPDPGTEPKLAPLSAEERAKEEAEIRANGGAADLKK